ncbi:hypothetical protein MRB53_020567 [Persea americana]|uniref:Uncharacterized protein n=1 Tax=Persea americana TaxID=3435 RepID=A0ACC2L1X1_PERAE|nr:hypothetical protein MRB53_020567 [Persea americana]
MDFFFVFPQARFARGRSEQHIQNPFSLSRFFPPALDLRVLQAATVASFASGLASPTTIFCCLGMSTDPTASRIHVIRSGTTHFVASRPVYGPAHFIAETLLQQGRQRKQVPVSLVNRNFDRP